MAASPTDSTQIAGRYARALFELAEAEKSAEAVAGELTGMAGLVVDSAELDNTLHNPTINRKEKAGLMEALLTRAKAETLLHRFVLRLALNNRLAHLEAINVEFQRLVSRARGEVVVQITTARKLDKAQQKALAGGLEKAVGGRTRLDMAIDSGLLAGVTIKIGSKLLDCSLRGKLQRVAATLDEQIMQGV